MKPFTTMKILPIILTASILAATACAQEEPDPTRASPRMKAALMAGGSAVPEMAVKGLVLAPNRESGSVIFEVPGGARFLARPKVPFTVIADGEARKLLIKSISGQGIEIEATAQKETVIIPTFGPIREPRPGLPGEVDYVEFRDLPLLDALRMLSDQTGNNYSASVEANKIPVNALLRNVSAGNVVEEICKSHNLWFKRDGLSGITRIMTVGEFEKDLVGFREEQTEVFTLRYPNVNEVAVSIADLFGDRVELSLSGEENDEDMQTDLESRFDRFDVVNQRTQQAGALNGNILGSNVNGFLSSGSGVQGFGGTNSGFGGSSSRNRLGEGTRRNRNDRDRTGREAMEDEAFRDLTPEQAQRVERALTTNRRGDDAEVEALRKRPATIYVTASRRNNMVVVRTADSRAMDDIRVLVNRIDVPTPLILLEVKVLSIELGRGFESAFDYAFFDGRVGGSFTTGPINPSVMNDVITNNPIGVTPLPGFGVDGLRDGQFIFQYLGNSVRARIQLLENKNRVKTIATPTLLTANNEISRLFLGEERPLVRGINSQTIITDNNVATTPNTQAEFRNVGNTLLITPNINSDRTVTLRLVQENSSISPNKATIPVVTNSGGNSSSTTVQNVPVDVVATRSISGTFVAKDGMAVVAGGLIEDVDSDRRAQVPLLGDIPGLGVLFRRQSKEKSRRELVIIIRPYVMSTPADGERISKNLLHRLAPQSMERLVEEGFLSSLPPAAVPPRPKIIHAATKPAGEAKRSVTPKKTSSSR